MTRAARLRGDWRPGQSVAWTSRRGGEMRGALVAFRGSRWLVRTTSGEDWRVPAALLRDAPGAAQDPTALLRDGLAAEEESARRRRARNARVDDRLAAEAARFAVGQTVEVVHRGSWGWRTTVVDIRGGKVVVENPTTILEQTFLGAGAQGLPPRRRPATVTLWANRVRPLRPL